MSNLNDLNDVLELAQKHNTIARQRTGVGLVEYGNIYCPSCGDDRKMKVSDFAGLTAFATSSKPELQSRTNFICTYTCLQCATTLTAVVYKGPSGLELLVLPSVLGGISTQHTPEPVKYYLDQAMRCQSAGAYSAAIAMFRSALEHLLHEQGYVKGMLHQKIIALENGTEVIPPPKWIANLNPEFLKVIKDLGNGAIHANDGDISAQSVLDNQLVEVVKATFQSLLDVAYEQPFQEVLRLQAMQKALSSFPKK